MIGALKAQNKLWYSDGHCFPVLGAGNSECYSLVIILPCIRSPSIDFICSQCSGVMRGSGKSMGHTGSQVSWFPYHHSPLHRWRGSPGASSYVYFLNSSRVFVCHHLLEVSDDTCQHSVSRAAGNQRFALRASKERVAFRYTFLRVKKCASRAHGPFSPNWALRRVKKAQWISADTSRIPRTTLRITGAGLTT